MTDHAEFQVSHAFSVLTPKQDEAIPIPCKEWDFIRVEVQGISSEPQLFHTLGSALIGASLSTIISIWTGAVSTATIKNADVIAWAVVAVTAICGALCLYFSNEQRAVHKKRSKDLVTYMNLIESRFERKKT